MRRVLAAALVLFCAATTLGDDLRPLSERAWAFWKDGRMEESLAAFRELLAASRAVGDRKTEASTVNFIGLWYQMMGNLPAARRKCDEALPMARAAGDRNLEGIVLYQLAWLRFMNHDYRGAVRRYEESLAVRRAIGDLEGEAVTLAGLGMAYNSLADWARAIEIEQKALPLAEVSNDRRLQADILDHTGRAMLGSGRAEEAEALHRRALTIRREIDDHAGQTLSLSALAYAQQARGYVDGAIASMREVVAIVESAREAVASSRLRQSMFASRQGHYLHLVDVLMEAHRESEALEVSERARGRATLDAIHDALLATDPEMAALLGQEQTLRAELERKEQARDALIARGASAEAVRQADDAIETLVGELRQVTDRDNANPRLAALRRAAPLTAAEISHDVLDDETALLEYAEGEKQSFVWLVTPSTLESRVLAPRGQIEAAARRLHTLLAARDQRRVEHDLTEAAATLSRMVLPPMALPPRVKRIVVVADGALQFIPFAMLAPRRGRPLLDDYEVTAAPSASVIALMRRLNAARRAPLDGVAVVADPVFRAQDPRVTHALRKPASSALSNQPVFRSAKESGLSLFPRLPYTRDEADAIIALAPGARLRAVDFDASRATVTAPRFGEFGVIHLATHALLNTQHPELSGIVLSLVDRQGRPQNGFLSATDIYALRLRSSLVVLSACRTALGKDVRGEGLVGLVRAFMYAGAPSVVASYWDVSDAGTAELMKRFYRGVLVDRQSPSAALHAAQRSLARENGWRAPRTWAAFTLQGDWR